MNQTLVDGNWRTSFERIDLGRRVVVLATLTSIEGPGRRVRGVAICSPMDRFDPKLGEQIALGRAYAEVDGRAQARRLRRAERERRARERKAMARGKSPFGAPLASDFTIEAPGGRHSALIREGGE